MLRQNSGDEENLSAHHAPVQLHDATPDEWVQMESLGDDLFQAARHSHYAHFDEAKRLGNKNHVIGTWAAALAAVSGASLLARIGDIHALAGAKVYIEVLQGLIALTASILSTIQTRLNYAKLADGHRHAAAEYGAFRRNLKVMFRYPIRMRDDLRLYFDKVERDLRALAIQSPQISDDTWANTEARLKADPSHLLDEKEDEPV